MLPGTKRQTWQCQLNSQHHDMGKGDNKMSSLQKREPSFLASHSFEKQITASSVEYSFTRSSMHRIFDHDQQSWRTTTKTFSFAQWLGSQGGNEARDFSPWRYQTLITLHAIVLRNDNGNSLHDGAVVQSCNILPPLPSLCRCPKL